MAIDDHDNETIRCPRMGDFVPFEFCRTSGRPFCHVIINCWAPRIDIGAFLAGHYEPGVIRESLQRPEAGHYKKILELSLKYVSK